MVNRRRISVGEFRPESGEAAEILVVSLESAEARRAAFAARAAAKKAGFAAEPGSYAVEGDIASAGVSSRELPSDSDAARAKAFVDFQNDVTAKDIRLALREGFR